MKAVPILHTERCILNGITQEDIPTLRLIVDDALFRRFLPELYKLVRSPKGLQRFLDAFKEYLIQDEGVLWGIRKENQLIGFVALMDFSCCPSISYAMHPDYRNQGYAKESVAAAVNYFKTISSQLELQTVVYKDNEASLSVLRSCGFRESAEIHNKFVMTLGS